jgi:hypothetical protein
MGPDDVLQVLMRELLVNLSEGNPGAISVLRMMLDEYPEDTFEVSEKLVKHQIKGSDLWVLFKEKDKDIHQFVTYIKSLE